MPPATVFRALRRYTKDGLRYVDRRRLNFQKAWERRVKLRGAVKDYLLSHSVLSEWAPLSLEKWVKVLAQLGVRVAPHTLSAFYRRHKVTYRVVKYKFSRADKVPLAQTQGFVVELARRIERDENIVYFDETSCNMWMRKRYAWSSRDHPVRMHLNKDRGKGVTIMGAIGHRLPKGVFSLARTTNQQEVGEFLHKLRDVVTPNRFAVNERIVLVLDNHPSHGTDLVRGLARQLNVELLFLPPYSPELNSIESLWAVFKLDLKNRLQQHPDVNLAQDDFRTLVYQCIANVTAAQQQRAARHNNRAYMHRMLCDMIDPQPNLTKEELRQRVIDEVGPVQRRVPWNSLVQSPQVLTPLALSPRHS